MKLHLFILALFLPCTVWGNSWLIVANGPAISIEDLQEHKQDRKILALDGAVNRFKSLPFYPECLLGDFDSVEDPKFWGISAVFSELDEQSTPYEGNFGIKIIPAKNQDHTDLEKGIFYCDEIGATSIHIVQATGGRMDHTLGNLGILKKHHSIDRELIIMTESEQIFYVCDASVAIKGGEGEYCAIMGCPEAHMTTSGLAYNGSNYLLRMGFQESICNKIADLCSSISIEGEALVILPKSSTFIIKSLESQQPFCNIK